MSDSVRPFTVAIPDSDLDDLHARLRNTRWGDAEVVDDWSQGIPLAYVRDVATYWAEKYDWRAREALLNRFDQFVTEIDGVDIHFQHVRSPHDDALPLLLSHGWPGSVVEFQKVIEPLTNPTAFGGDAADAFHVVVPSLPGFGFSGRPTTTGWGVERIGAAFAALMARLGYSRYVAQGGDWGSAITSVIGATDAEHCAMIGLTLAMSAPSDGRAEHACRAPRRRAHPVLHAVGLGLLHPAAHAPTDRGVRIDRFARRSARVDPREVLGMDRLRRASRERAHARRAARQRDAVLAARARRPRRLASIGRASGGEVVRSSTCQPGSPCTRRRSCRP